MIGLARFFSFVTFLTAVVGCASTSVEQFSGADDVEQHSAEETDWDGFSHVDNLDDDFGGGFDDFDV